MKMKTVLATALAASIAPMAHAATLYSNVGITTSTSGELTSGTYSGVSNQFVSGNNGYNFVYAAGSVGGAPHNGGCGFIATCANGEDGLVGMWAIPTNTTSLGANGAFLALDSDYNTAGTGHGVSVSETVNGLTVGDMYTIAFNTADAQQNTYTGASEDYVQLCFGGVCLNTVNALDNAGSGGSGDYTPWVANSFSFTATSASETLSLLGIGGAQYSDSNVPSFALVDDLSITQNTPSPTPEPGSLALLGTGLAGLGGLVRSRISKALATRSL